MKKFILMIIEKIRKALKVDEKGNSFGWRKGTLLLAALMMVGCGEYKVNKPVMSGYSVVDIDSCEYIKEFSRIAHKGNCQFCKERRQKELKELIEQLKRDNYESKNKKDG